MPAGEQGNDPSFSANDPGENGASKVRTLRILQLCTTILPKYFV